MIWLGKGHYIVDWSEVDRNYDCKGSSPLIVVVPSAKMQSILPSCSYLEELFLLLRWAKHAGYRPSFYCYLWGVKAGMKMSKKLWWLLTIISCAWADLGVVATANNPLSLYKSTTILAVCRKAHTITAYRLFSLYSISKSPQNKPWLRNVATAW